MDPSEQKRFDELYRKHLRVLKLQGMSDKTIDADLRTVRRIAAWFDYGPGRLEPGSRRGVSLIRDFSSL